MSKADHPFDASLPYPGFAADIRRDFAMPLIVIGLLVILAITASVHFGVKALDEESAAREQQLVRNGLELRVAEVAALVVPQVDWDDTVRNIDNAFDPAWTDENINEFLDHTYGFHAQYVVDANNVPVFAALGETTEIGIYRRVAGHVGDLLASVRRQEAARGAIAKSSGPDPVSSAIQASGVKMIEGHLTILTATLVQPDFGKALPRGPRAPIVLTEMRVDEPFLAQFSKRFLLKDVYVRTPAQRAQAGRIEVPVKDEKGTVQAYLAWTPLEPGYGMLNRMATMLLLGMLPLLAIAAIELRRIFRAARKLIERERLNAALALHAMGEDFARLEHHPA